MENLMRFPRRSKVPALQFVVLKPTLAFAVPPNTALRVLRDVTAFGETAMDSSPRLEMDYHIVVIQPENTKTQEIRKLWRCSTRELLQRQNVLDIRYALPFLCKCTSWYPDFD